MTQSIEIVLPKDVEPAFPDQCIVCCAPPNSTTKIFAQTYNPFLNLFMPIVILFGWLQIEIPICSSCKLVFKAQRWGLVFASFLFGAFAAYWLLQNFNEFSLVLKIMSIPCLFLFAGLPHALAAFISPPYFDATALSNKVEYEFAKIDYASKFHLLNESHILDSDFYEQ
jgi:hypothetical protein